MKSATYIRLSIMITLIFILNVSFAQDEEPSGLLGDNFSLESTLEAFKNASSIEAFEATINSENQHIHNLDLNGDQDIDYITVNDYVRDDVHILALSAVIGDDDGQDIAVIEIEKTGDKTASLQIIGDEDLYGADMIVEPYDIEGSTEGQGPNTEMTLHRIVVNVWLWPSVRYIYRPGYVHYRSPWRWGYYPRVWRPWRPLGWTVWRPYRVRYTPVYRISPVRRVNGGRKIYTPHRRVSTSVRVRHNTAIAKAGTVKRTKTTSVVRSGNGKTRTVSKKTTVARKSKGTKSKTTKQKVKATNGNKTVKKTKQTKAKKTAKGKKKGVKKTKTKKVKKKGS